MRLVLALVGSTSGRTLPEQLIRSARSSRYCAHRTLQDLRDYWAAGKALYDPGNIRVPTLLTHAEWDADLPSDQAHAYFAKLNYRPYSTLIFSGRVNCAGYTANVFYFVHGFYWRNLGHIAQALRHPHVCW
jgi:hypothetical protein